MTYVIYICAKYKTFGHIRHVRRKKTYETYKTCETNKTCEPYKTCETYKTYKTHKSNYHLLS